MLIHSASVCERTRRRVLLMLCPTREEQVHKIAQGIARYLAHHGNWEIYLDDTFRAAGEASCWPGGDQWDGVICRSTNPTIADVCARSRIPLVTINHETLFPEVPNIVLDHLAVGQLGAEHLIDRGIVHFAFAGFSNLSWSRARRKGFLQTLQSRGKHCRLIESVYPMVETSAWDGAEVSLLSGWLKDTPRPLGLMACDDLRGAQMIRAAASIGLSVPEDVAVLGANDNETRCVLSQPALSSVGANEIEWGYKAAEALHRLMEGSRAVDREISVAPAPVVTRNSTEILAVDDKKVAAAIGYIRQYGCGTITIGDVCRHAGVARTQLEQKFREYFGRSPQAELRRVRLTRIRQLLHETDLPLKTIAEQTGFEHVEYMSVFCKKALGESPGRYRRRVRAREAPPAEDVLAQEAI